MIKISNPLIKQGELITHYNGYNRKINQSEQHLTSQRIKFITSQELNGGDEANYCFEFKLLNRKFLMALDQEKLYEILEDGDDKVYVLLTESWFYILRSFEEGKKHITQITLTLHYEYTPQAEFHENFDVQLNMLNESEVKYWFSQIRPREEEM